MRRLKNNKPWSKTTADDLLGSHYRKALFRHFHFPLSPTVKLYNNSSRREQQGIFFFPLLCNRSGLLTRLLHTLTQTESSEDSVLCCSKTTSWHFFILCSWRIGFSPMFSIIGIYSVSTSINEYGDTHNKF